MKKRILSIVIICFFCSIIGMNNVRATTVIDGSIISQIYKSEFFKGTLGYEKAYKIDDSTRINFYKISGYSKDSLMRIYNAKIGGNSAFCLDPGKSSGGEYNENSSATFDDDTKKLYAAIYKANFNFTVHQRTLNSKYDNEHMVNVGDDKNAEYIVKQILFWALAGNEIKNVDRFDEIFDNKVTIKGDKSEYDVPLVLVDILESLLYYKNNKDGKINKGSIGWWANDTTVRVSTIDLSSILLNKTLDAEIKKSFKESYSKIKSIDASEIDVREYTSVMGDSSHQRFVGIGLPDDPLELDKDTDTDRNDTYIRYTYIKDSKSNDYSDDYSTTMSGKSVTISRKEFKTPSDTIYEYIGYSIFDSDEKITTTISTYNEDKLTLENTKVGKTNYVVFYYKTRSYTLTLKRNILDTKDTNGRNDTYTEKPISVEVGDRVKLSLDYYNDNDKVTYDSILYCGCDSSDGAYRDR